jgi:hypothetical protein
MEVDVSGRSQACRFLWSRTPPEPLMEVDILGRLVDLSIFRLCCSLLSFLSLCLPEFSLVDFYLFKLVVTNNIISSVGTIIFEQERAPR